MKATFEIDGKVKVEFCVTHACHDFELCHLRLHTDKRKGIVSKIATKIPFETILDDVQKSVDSAVKRKHLLTKQDLRNIAREYSLHRECVRHADDATSVESWVEMQRESESNSVLLHKTYGVCLDEYPDLKKDDFLLAIMNEAQLAMLKKYGDDLYMY